MKLLFININYNWVYNLFIDYILTTVDNIKQNYDCEIDIIHLDIKNYNLDIFLFLNYDKVIYSGDITIFNNIIENINKIYSKLLNTIYYLNIEQLSHPSYYKNLRNIDTNIKIIDYSEENMPFLNCYDVKYIIPPYFKKENEMLISNKSIEILSLNNNQYRSNLINNINNELSKNDLPQITSINNCYGTERDDIYRKTKIYINIHCSDDHRTMEMIRIVNLLSKNVIIVSFGSINPSLLKLHNNIYIVNTIENLIQVITELHKNYDIYYDYCKNKFNDASYNKYVNSCLDKLLH